VCAASSATAAVRVSDPLGSGTACTDAAPCPITTAINGAADNDEIIVNPGEYGTVAAPISTALSTSATNVTIHGRDGSTRPTIVSSNAFALTLGGTGGLLRDISLRSVYSTNGLALTLTGSATAERVEIRADGSGSVACELLGTSLIRDSICLNTGAGATALDANSTQCCSSINATARNVTAIATGTPGTDLFGNGMRVYAATGRASTLTAVNVIAVGTKHSIEVWKDAADPATARLSHVDATDIHVDGGGNTVDLGGNTTAAPSFADASAFNFHELPTSPTVDAGIYDALNGTLAFDGTLRTLGGHTDIGAAEYIPPPSATTGVASSVGTTSATVAGIANANGGSGSVHFEYGTTTAYGQATSDIPISGTSDTATTATLTGLTPGTTYHYRLVASTSSGTVPGADGSFTTQSLPLLAPVLSAVKQSRRVWRVDRRHKTPAVARTVAKGTTFSYTLSSDATVTFTIQRARPHKKFKTAMRLRRTVHAGANRTRFTGRVGRKVLKPGRYRVVIRAKNTAGSSKAATLTFRVVR
jgi:hypothetical protein